VKTYESCAQRQVHNKRHYAILSQSVHRENIAQSAELYQPKAMMFSTLRAFSTFVLFLVLMLSMSFAVFAIDVIVDGSRLVTDPPAQIVENRTMVPLRSIFEALGADVQWIATEQRIVANRSDEHVELVIGSTEGTKNGSYFTMDVPAQIIDGRTFVLVRAIAEALACEVSFDIATQVVTVRSSTIAVSTGAPIGYLATLEVYVSHSSSTIHTESNCSGMKKFDTMTLTEALRFTQKYCQKCANHLTR